MPSEPCKARIHGSGAGPWVVSAASGKPRNRSLTWKGTGGKEASKTAVCQHLNTKSCHPLLGAFIRPSAFKFCVARLLMQGLCFSADRTVHLAFPCTHMWCKRRALRTGQRSLSISIPRCYRACLCLLEAVEPELLNPAPQASIRRMSLVGNTGAVQSLHIGAGWEPPGLGFGVDFNSLKAFFVMVHKSALRILSPKV